MARSIDQVKNVIHELFTRLNHTGLCVYVCERARENRVQSQFPQFIVIDGCAVGKTMFSHGEMHFEHNHRLQARTLA